MRLKALKVDVVHRRNYLDNYIVALLHLWYAFVKELWL